MKKIKLKKIWITIILWLLSIIYIPNNIFAEDLNDLDIDWFYIIKEVEDIGKLDDAIKIVWATWWKVWETYNATASGLKTSEQIATWIMNWDTLMNYLVYIVQFTSQLWLVVWGWFIMYAWYKYINPYNFINLYKSGFTTSIFHSKKRNNLSNYRNIFLCYHENSHLSYMNIIKQDH